MDQSNIFQQKFEPKT